MSKRPAEAVDVEEESGQPTEAVVVEEERGQPAEAAVVEENEDVSPDLLDTTPLVNTPFMNEFIESTEWFLSTARLPVEWAKEMFAPEKLFHFACLKAVRHIYGHGFHIARARYNREKRRAGLEYESTSINRLESLLARRFDLVMHIKARAIFADWLQSAAPRIYTSAVALERVLRAEIKRTITNEPEPDGLDYLQKLVPSLFLKKAYDEDVAITPQEAAVAEPEKANEAEKAAAVDERENETLRIIVAIQKKRRISRPQRGFLAFQ